MDLSKEQKEQLQSWITTGLSVPAIYKLISNEWKNPMTYMELKFAIDDLNLEFPKEIKIPEAEAKKEDLIPLNGEEEPHKVTMEIDKIMRPGAIISGTVAFSDGMTGSWQLDQRGRIAISPATEAYHPSQEDIHEFEKQLQEALHKAGY
jgi:hypothetical protein